MEKRTERNKKLYEQVNKEIKAKAMHSSNEDFKGTSNTLKSINPQLFGNGSEDDIVETKTTTPKKKKVLIPIIVLAVLIILIVIIAICI